MNESYNQFSLTSKIKDNYFFNTEYKEKEIDVKVNDCVEKTIKTINSTDCISNENFSHSKSEFEIQTLEINKLKSNRKSKLNKETRSEFVTSNEDESTIEITEEEINKLFKEKFPSLNKEQTKTPTKKKVSDVGSFSYDKKYKIIAQGKVKNIWKSVNEETKTVFLTSKSDKYFNYFIGKTKEQELRDEVAIAKAIEKKLFVYNLNNFLTKHINEKLDKMYINIIMKDFILTYKTMDAFIDHLKKLKNEESAKEKFLKKYYMDEERFDKFYEFFTDEENKNLCSGSNIALDLKEVEGKELIDEKYTIVTSQAKSDMEDQIRSKMSFYERTQLALQFFRGMRDLHNSGYVAGDIKPENLLYYTDGKVKISDFGKTKPINKDEDLLHSGNPRYAPPEGRISKRGEVYSSALVMIRILEEEFLSEEETFLMDENILEMDLGFENTDKKRRGIEKFVVSNKNCPQSETTTLMGQLNFGYKQATLWYDPSNVGDLQKAEEDVHAYIRCLKNKLLKKYPDDSEAINKIEKLLKSMTVSDRMKRPTMSQAFFELDLIFSKINKDE